VKGKIGKIKEKENGDLILRYEDISEGIVKEAEHDMVVLSVGSQSNPDSGKIFPQGALKLDPFKFVAQTDLYGSPAKTSIDGVFVAGTAAAPMAHSRLHPLGRGSILRSNQLLNSASSMKERIGVYICHCGGNISDYVDVEKVRQAIENEEGVALAKTTMFACSDANQNEMVEDIRNHNLDGVIVASCSPKLHLTTFRNVTERGELNKYTYVHTNIREQASWAHSDDKPGATEKAIQPGESSHSQISLRRAALSQSV